MAGRGSDAECRQTLFCRKKVALLVCFNGKYPSTFHVVLRLKFPLVNAQNWRHQHLLSDLSVAVVIVYFLSNILLSYKTA